MLCVVAVFLIGGLQLWGYIWGYNPVKLAAGTEMHRSWPQEWKLVTDIESLRGNGLAVFIGAAAQLPRSRTCVKLS